MINILAQLARERKLTILLFVLALLLLLLIQWSIGAFDSDSGIVK